MQYLVSVLKRLKGKDFKQGEEILKKNHLICVEHQKNHQMGLMEFYFRFGNNKCEECGAKLNISSGFFRYTTKYKEIGRGEESVDFKNGYWQLKLDNKMYL